MTDCFPTSGTPTPSYNHPPPPILMPPGQVVMGPYSTAGLALLMLGQGIAGWFQPNSNEKLRPRLLVGSGHRLLEAWQQGYSTTSGMAEDLCRSGRR